MIKKVKIEVGLFVKAMVKKKIITFKSIFPGCACGRVISCCFLLL